MATTIEEFDMAVRTEIDAGSTVTISDSRTSVSGAAPLTHWTYRRDVNETVTVTVDGATSTHLVATQPAAGLLRLGAQVYPTHHVTNAHRDIGPELDALPDTIDFVRIGIPWRLLQPSSAAWDEAEASYLDGVFADLTTRGIDVLLTVGTTPVWALASGSDTLMPAANPATFGAWVDAIIDRWASVVTIIGIDPWNEPNLDAFFHGTDAQFVAMVQAAHVAADGRVPTSCGSIAGADWSYLSGLFALGLTSADFDILDAHPYPVAFSPDQTTMRWVDPHVAPPDADITGSLIGGTHALQRVLADNAADGKPIWFSEWGVGSNRVDRVNPGRRMTDVRAAEWVATGIDQASRINDVAGLCIHEAVDLTGQSSGWNQGWGLLRPDLSRRSKWNAVANA